MKKKRKWDSYSLTGSTNFLLKMKLLTLLICVSLASFAANSYSQQAKFSIHVDSKSLKDVFKQIEGQSEYIFIYSENDIDLDRKVDVNVENMSVNEILDEIFRDTYNYYEVHDRQIVVLSKAPKKEDVQVKKNLQEHSVQGTITDESGAPIPGVTVVVQDANKGTITDINGRYKISGAMGPETFIEFSFIGLKTQKIKIDGRIVIDVVMETDEYEIDDVTVVGAYGTVQKRTDMVGSAYQVDAEQIKNRPATRVDALLDGMIPGLKIEPNTDSPDNTRTRFTTRIRGTASLSASNEPLWIVDGTPMYTGGNTNMIPGMGMSISPLSGINPQDIESITVLKDATATSIYGANGANGVILVTTKSGGESEPSLSVQARYGVSRVDKSTLVKTMNGKDYLMLAREAYQNAGLDMDYFPFQDNDLNQFSETSTDWADVFFGLGNNSLVNLVMSGGSKKSSYYISGSYYNESQTVKGNNTDRYSFRTNNKINVTDKLLVSFILSASYSIDDIFNMGRDYYEFLPIYSPYYSEGTFRLYNQIIDGRKANGEPNWITQKFFNSVAEREENDYRQRAFMSNANLMLSYDILKSLKFTTQLGMDYQSRFEDRYDARTNWSGMDLDGTPSGYSNRSHINTLLVTNINRLNYSQTFGKHKVNGLLGMEVNSRTYRTTSSRGSGFVNDHIKEVSYAVDQYGSSSADIDHAMSFFGQLAYGFDSRHFLTFNARADGNSSFGDDVRWGKFYSFGYSWNIHNESFFSSGVIDVLKLKASYGTNGNSRLGSQTAEGIYSYNSNYNYYNEQGTTMQSSPQPTLSWETTQMTNIGVRLRLFDRLDIDAEWYNNKTVDLLSEIDASRTTGSISITRNIGEIRNRGVEATISMDWLTQSDFFWSTSINMAHNENVLLKLNENITKTVGTRLWREGEGVDTYYLVRWAGVDPRDGAPLWYDIDGNVTRSYSYDNRVPGKSSTPFLTGGATNTVGYKNFSFSMLLNYEIGGYAFSSYARNVVSDGRSIMSQNQSVNQLDRWQNPGDVALNPKPIWGVSTQSMMNSTRFLYEKTNIRLQNIALTYTFPDHILDTLGLGKASISLIGDNLGLWTRHDSKDRNSYRQLMSGFPKEQVYSLSVNLSF